MKNIILVGCIVTLLIGSCARQESGEKAPLVGRIMMEEVYKTCPRFQQTVNEYEPDQEIVQRLKEVERPVTCLVFLGTWCSDSEEHVPPFERLITAAANPHLTVIYYGVDRQKDDGVGLARQYDIQYVPTFVVLEDGRETGRIVETPTITIGDDLVNILKGEN